MGPPDPEQKARKNDPPARREPLPWSQPKPIEDDPEATARVRQNLESRTYLRAAEDVAFLDRDDLRSLRLQLEYLRADLLLAEAGVRGTIAVFGGTRLVEPSAARRKVERAEQELKARPGDAELERKRDVARRVLAKSGYYDVAREVGRIVGRSGEGPLDCQILVMTGGGPGAMEAANRGAYDVGAKSIGLNITLPLEQYPNPYISPELCFQFQYFALRKMHFLLRTKALITFPGGYGTLDEFFETLCLIQTRKMNPVPVILVGEKYWRGVVDFDYLVAEGMIDREDAELFWFAETAEEIWTGICNWYEQAGERLFLC